MGLASLQDMRLIYQNQIWNTSREQSKNGIKKTISFTKTSKE